MQPKLCVKTILRDYWVILLAPVLLLGPFLARGQVLFWGTPSLQFVPWWVYAWDCLRQGVLPLWNPLNGMGAPLIANYQLAFFYPPNWLLILFAGLGGKTFAAAMVAWGYTFLAMLHLAWGGLGMSMLLRRLGFPWLAQVVGGLAFGLSGYVVARLGFFSMVWVAAWLPWVIYFADHLAGLGSPVEEERARFRLLPGLVLCIGMQLLAGHAQLTWYTLLLAGVWVTMGALRSGLGRSGWLKRLLLDWVSLAAAALLAAGLAAVQLVPTFEFLQNSQRASAYAEDAMTYSFWPWRLITLFSPDFFGSPAQGNYWGYASYWEDHLYAGLLPLLLALASFWLLIREVVRWRRQKSAPKSAPDKRRGIMIFAWLLVVLSFVLGLGRNTPVFPFLYQHVPTFSMFQAPARYLIWAAFTIPILAGVSIEHWRCPTGRGLYWFRLGTAGAFAVTLGAGLASIIIRDVRLTFIRATALAGLWTLGFGLLTLALPYAEKRGWLTSWRWAVIAWTLADLLVTGWGLNPITRVDFYTGQLALLEQAQVTGAGGRVYLSQRDEYQLKFSRFLRFKDFRPLEDWRSLRGALIPNLNLLEGIPSVNNFDPLLVDDYARWMEDIETLAPTAQKGWLAYMGVSAIEHIDVSEPGGVRFDPVPNAQRWHWFNCKRSWDGPWGIQEEMQLPPQTNRAVIVDDNDDAREVFPGDQCTGNGMAIVRWITDLPDRVVLDVDAPNPGWLVIADTWYPGWEASVDGNKVNLYKADGVFRAVVVGEGRHQVEIKYHPSGFYFAGLFSILILVFVGTMLIRWGRKSA
jgi:hypothetical protein